MPVPSALACVRCGARYPVDHYAQDCPACRARGAPANLGVVYDSVPGIGTDRAAIRRDRGSMWRWEGFLHASAAEAVTLGEGNTPLLPAPSLGLGDVWIKDELRNPTWSFKDRLGSGAVTMARRFGAKVVVSSSSGNAGASAAAFAAKAGLPCVVFTVTTSAGPLVLQMRAYGAMLVKVTDQDGPLASADARRARARLVSDLAVLRTGGRQQSLWHGRLQDDRLRDRRGLRLAAARLVRAAGVLRRRAVRHVEGLRGAEGAGLDRPHAALRRRRGLGLARCGDGRRRRDAARIAAQCAVDRDLDRRAAGHGPGRSTCCASRTAPR